MSVYRTIFNAVEESIFYLQVPNVKECIKYVEATTGIRHLDTDEIEKIMHRVATQYKQNGR